MADVKVTHNEAIDMAIAAIRRTRPNEFDARSDEYYRVNYDKCNAAIILLKNLKETENVRSNKKGSKKSG